MGRTDVRPGVARTLVLLFLLTAGLVPVLELAGVAGAGGVVPSLDHLGRVGRAVVDGRPLEANRLLLEEIGRIEELLEERSLLQVAVVPHAQWAETALLADGNRRALVGEDGWLVYRPDLEHVVGRPFLDPEVLEARATEGASWRPVRHPDPRPALERLHRQLAERGIELLVMPTPVKPAIEPERLVPGTGATRAIPLRNPSYSDLVADLEAAGIALADPAPILADGPPGEDRFLVADTHWTPAAMDRVAEALAREVEDRLGSVAEPVSYRRRPVPVRGIGDIARMLRLPDAAELFAPQEVTTRMVTMPDGSLWRPTRGAPVLLLGDSFTNVYSQDALGWGRGAGLAEQLAFHLRRPVDRIAVNAGGSHTTREALARELREDPGRLDGVRVVVYQFAARELSRGDWRPVDLGPAPGGAGAAADPEGAAGESADLLGEGFVVWESNRAENAGRQGRGGRADPDGRRGDWRLWTARLDGSGLRRLTPDEPGRQHCCAHIAPDGGRLVYLSREAPRDRYPDGAAPGELRLLDLEADGEGGVRPTGERVVAAAARTYGRGNRAAVWRSDHELIHVTGDGRTVLRDLADGSLRELIDTPPDGEGALGWLADATLGHATSGVATFSVYDQETGSVLERRNLGGCEPYFSHDGRWGFWVPGAGGPIDRIDLATRRVSTILDKNDPRLGDKGYLYFPMLSRNGRLFAFGASGGEHSHFEADYDIHLAPADPRSLVLVGPPVRIAPHPATDRYPDVFQSRPPPDAGEGTVPSAAHPEPSEATREEPMETGWPVRRDHLVFLWRTGNSPNLVGDPASGGRRAYSLEPEGRARLDHAYRMVLDHGAFVAPREAAQRLLDAAVESNELTVEATVVAEEASFDAPASGAGSDGGPPMRRIITFSSGAGSRNLTLGQRGRTLVARLQTGLTGPDADRPEVELFDIEAGRPTHVAFTYSPGRLVAYRDGEKVLETGAVTGSFTFHWKLRTLRFGREAGGAGDWHGLLEGVAIHARELSPEAIRESAERYRAIREARTPVPRWRVRSRLRATSEVPTLRQISPYRRALAVYEYRVQGEAERIVPDGGGDGDAVAPEGSIRVARWVLLDGEVQAEASLAPGSGQVLVLERYGDNPQLGDVYLSDTLPSLPSAGRPPGDASPLYYSVEP